MLLLAAGGYIPSIHYALEDIYRDISEFELLIAVETNFAHFHSYWILNQMSKITIGQPNSYNNSYNILTLISSISHNVHTL